MGVTAFLYDAEGRDQKVELSREVLDSLAAQTLLWIDVDTREADELKRVAAMLELDPASVRDLTRDRPQPRLDNYGNYAQFTVVTAPSNAVDSNGAVKPANDQAKNRADRMAGPRIDFVVSRNWLLTVHDGKLEFVESFRTKDRAETTIGALTTHDFAASLLDAQLEGYFEEVARIEAQVDRLDEQALTSPSSRTLLGRMVSLRRRVSRLRTLLASQRSVFYGLARPDLQLVSESGAAPHFQVLVGRFERAIDEVEHSRDLVVGSFELFATRTAQQTNDLVKVLTYLTAVVGICAAVAGVFGMNFETGIFSSGDFGFYATVGSLLFVTIAATAIARWRGWL